MTWGYGYPYLDQLVDGGERGLPVRMEGSGHVRGDGESGRLALDAGGGVPGEEGGAGQRGVLPVEAVRVELGLVAGVQAVLTWADTSRLGSHIG